jgi:TolB-like protein
LPLPDRPAIAVLPFTNMSGDPEQEYFSDGIYKGMALHMKQVAEELGVELCGRGQRAQER